MPPTLIKAFMAASSVITGTVATTTTTAVDDATTRFDAIVTGDMINTVAGTTTIPSGSFRDDAGEPFGGTLPVITAGGYYNVYINGILQESALTLLSPTGLLIASADILAGTPVNVEVHDYSGTTSTSTSVPALTVTTTVAT